MPRFKRLWNLVRRRDYTLREKLAHHRRIRHVIRITAAIAPLNKPCVIGWYSMLIRTTGDVVPCCILQGARLGSILEGGVKAAWQSPAYQRFRAELKETFDPHWEHDPSKHATVQPLCGATGRCPVMSYYVSDIPFAQNVSALTPAARSL
ncbi:MAG TPA: SPASM domain-containing protein [Thermoanaerobaculia bacterium]|nr:SPASM domain-containing protein [Thermoanaerobaculia bacterium]